MGGMMNGYGMGGGFFGLGLIFLLLIIAVILIVVWMVKPSGKRSDDDQTSGRNHEDILKSRLARGEISEDEYDRLKKKLDE
ncbi:SHOCT domain-containing protein [Salimicrobium album]|uniref:Membrane protein n=1 Tax=Salimicrobium album TaxID=50717 RepID=A0A1H3BP66_9BACI|nr:SHOCT domain-containing protein [Salimicrobium album]SDX43585.1 putative membrane protein [Salimicrobium album]